MVDEDDDDDDDDSGPAYEIMANDNKNENVHHDENPVIVEKVEP